MANELQIPGGVLSFIKGVQNNTIPIPSLSVTVAGKAAIHAELTLSTVDATLNKGLIGTIGLFFIRNEDPTNNVLIGTDGTTYPITLTPSPAGGSWTIGFLSAALSIHVKASAATPTIEYFLVEA